MKLGNNQTEDTLKKKEKQSWKKVRVQNKRGKKPIAPGTRQQSTTEDLRGKGDS